MLPSLDAAENRAFNRITRPRGGLEVERVIAGLVAFRRQFRGQLWLEVMLVRGYNNSLEQLTRLKAAIETINPDRIHLNTVVRPPADARALPVAPDRMAEIASYFGPRCEVIADCPRKVPSAAFEVKAELILQTLKRRPTTLHELAESLSFNTVKVYSCVERFMVEGRVQAELHRGITYYSSRGLEETT